MKMDPELVGPARGAGGTGRDGGTMKMSLDRLQADACLVRLRAAMDADAAATRDDKGAVADELGMRINGSSWRKLAETATVDIRETVEVLQQSLDEVDRLREQEKRYDAKRILLLATCHRDDLLSQAGIIDPVLVVRETLEQAEVQVRRLREGLVKARDALAAAMRVIVNCGAVEDYITAATDAGVTEGFGERIEQALAETEGS